jgi:hypothetical protein
MSRGTEFGLIYNGKTGSAREYWQGALPTDRRDAIFPIGASRKPHRSIEEPLALTISGATFERLTKLTAGSPLLLYVTLLAAVKVCLYKYSRGNIIAVGGPPQSVDDESLELPHALVIIDRIDGGMSFRTLLLSVKDTVIETYQYSGRPFRNVVRGSGENEERQFRPQVWLVVKDFHGDSRPATSDIELRFERGAAEVHGIASFDHLLFGPDIVQRFIGDFLDVLRTFRP